MSKGKPLDMCKTCGSAIVATVNESVFRDGECDGCEYERYRTQPELAATLDELLATTFDQDLASGNELSDRESALRERASTLLERCFGSNTQGKSRN